MSECLGQFADTWQTAVQHFFAQVIELEHYVIAIWTTTVTGDDLFNHGACYHVTTSKVFGVRSITLHETLAVLVDQVTTFTTATFCNQYTCAGDAGWVELPHLDILNRHACTQRHADTVTGIDQCVGGRRVDATSAASGQYRRVCADVRSFTGFDADRDDTDEHAVLVFHQIHCIVFVEEYSAGFQVGLVKSVQQRVTGTVGSCASTCSLTALAKVF